MNTTTTAPSKLSPVKFRNFYLSLKSNEDRSVFKEKFLDLSKLKSPTFDNYKKEKNCLKKIPYLSSQVIIQLAKELHPDLLNLLY